MTPRKRYDPFTAERMAMGQARSEALDMTVTIGDPDVPPLTPEERACLIARHRLCRGELVRAPECATHLVGRVLVAEHVCRSCSRSTLMSEAVAATHPVCMRRPSRAMLGLPAKP